MSEPNHEMLPANLELFARKILITNSKVNIDLLIIICELARFPSQFKPLTYIFKNGPISEYFHERHTISTDIIKRIKECNEIELSMQLINGRHSHVAKLKKDILCVKYPSYEACIGKFLRESLWEIRKNSKRVSARAILLIYAVYVRKLNHSGDVFRFINSHREQDQFRYSNQNLPQLLAKIGLIKIIRTSTNVREGMIYLPTLEIKNAYL